MKGSLFATSLLMLKKVAKVLEFPAQSALDFADLGIETESRPQRTIIPPLRYASREQEMEMNERILNAMTRLKAEGTFRDEVYAAIVGNAQTESGLLPNRIQGSTEKAPMYGYTGKGGRKSYSPLEIVNWDSNLGAGLMQWDKSRRNDLFKFAIKKGIRPEDAIFDSDLQWEFVIHEINSSSRFSSLKKKLENPALTIDQLSDLVAKIYLVPKKDKGYDENLRKRRENAKAALEIYVQNRHRVRQTLPNASDATKHLDLRLD